MSDLKVRPPVATQTLKSCLPKEKQEGRGKPTPLRKPQEKRARCIVPLPTCDSVYFRFKKSRSLTAVRRRRDRVRDDKATASTLLPRKSRSLTAVRRGRDRVRDDTCSAGPDAGGEGLDGVETEFFVELDGGVVFGSDGQS